MSMESDRIVKDVDCITSLSAWPNGCLYSLMKPVAETITDSRFGLEILNLTLLAITRCMIRLVEIATKNRNIFDMFIALRGWMTIGDGERLAKTVIATLRESQNSTVSRDGPREIMIQTAQRAIEQLKMAVHDGLFGAIESLAHFYLGQQLIELGFLQYENADQVRTAIVKTGIDSIPLFRDGVEEVITAAQIDGSFYRMRNMFDVRQLLSALSSVSLVIVYQSEFVEATSDVETAIAYLKKFATRFHYVGDVMPYVYSKLGEYYFVLDNSGEGPDWFRRVVSTSGLKHNMPLAELKDGRPSYQVIIDHAEARIEEFGLLWDRRRPTFKNPWARQKPANKRWRWFQ